MMLTLYDKKKTATEAETGIRLEKIDVSDSQYSQSIRILKKRPFKKQHFFANGLVKDIWGKPNSNQMLH